MTPPAPRLRVMRHLLGIASIVIAFVSGCSPAIPYFRYQFDARAVDRAEIRHVVVRSVAVPEEWREHEDRIDDAIARHLRSAGFTVVSFDAARPHWDAALADAAAPYDPRTGEADPEQLRAIYLDYLARLDQAGIADAVVEPAVVARKAKLSAQVALWDGVRRRIPMHSGDVWNWGGSGDVLSLRVTVYATDGSLILSNYGGLEYPYEHGMKGRKIVTRVRDDLFLTREFVESAVRIAFHPLVPDPRIPDKPRFYEDRID